MTIGSTANLGFAFDTLRTWRGEKALDPAHRLLLILISDQFGNGACVVSNNRLQPLTGLGDPIEVGDGLVWLARCGLIRLSRYQDFDTAFAGSIIATEAEIAAARHALGCNWPFHNWPGES